MPLSKETEAVNNIFTVLLQVWIWHWITHKGWYAIKQRNWSRKLYLYCSPTSMNLALNNPQRLIRCQTKKPKLCITPSYANQIDRNKWKKKKVNDKRFLLFLKVHYIMKTDILRNYLYKKFAWLKFCDPKYVAGWYAIKKRRAQSAGAVEYADYIFAEG